MSLYFFIIKNIKKMETLAFCDSINLYRSFVELFMWTMLGPKEDIVWPDNYIHMVNVW